MRLKSRLFKVATMRPCSFAQAAMSKSIADRVTEFCWRAFIWAKSDQTPVPVGSI